MRLWERGHGFKGGFDEPTDAYERFAFFLRLGPDRNFKAVVQQFNAPQSTVYVQAKRFNWRGRAFAYDKAPDAEKRLVGALPGVPLVPVDPEVLAADGSTVPPVPARYFGRQEEFRAEIEALGRSQIQTTGSLCKSLGELGGYAMELARELLRTRAARLEGDGEPQELQKREISLQGQLDTTSKSLQRIASSVSLMGQLGRENWGQAIGIDVMLSRFDELLAMEAGKGENETPPDVLRPEPTSNPQ